MGLGAGKMSSSVFGFSLILFAMAFAAGQEDEKIGIPDYSLTVRREIPQAFTWKIEDLYATPESWQADKEAVAEQVAAIAEKARDWTASPVRMADLLDAVFEIYLKLDRLQYYAAAQNDTDLGDARFRAMRGEIKSIAAQFSARMSFLEADLLALGEERFTSFLKSEPRLSPYRFFFENVWRDRDHVLPSDPQRIFSLTGLFSGAPSQAADVLNNVEIPPAEVTLSDGRQVVLNYANYLRWRGGVNPEDRRRVLKAFWNNQLRFQNTLAVLQDGAVKQHVFGYQVRRFPDCLQAALFADNIDPEVYHQLIRSVRGRLGPLHRFLALKQRLLGLETFRYEDVHASCVPAVKKTYTFAEAQALVTEALRPLGKEYAEALSHAFRDRWIDIYPNMGKESGAYSEGIYGVHPYIKLNFNGTYDSVSTLAHEIGHALHSYFADRNQPYATSQYSSFLAEVASTFNEHLLLRHMLSREEDDRVKLSIIDSYLERVRITLYRQTLFSEFELAMHRRAEAGQTLTPDWLNQRYLELTRQYYGHDQGTCQVDDSMQVEWSRISHFYLNFYVFQYSTGLIASLALSDMVLGSNTAQSGYLDLLRAGGSDYPIPLLKKAGVDMAGPAPYEAALNRFDQWVGEMEKIVARLDKKGR